MKAPERIWIDPVIDLPKLSGHINKDSVEYIRADTFIEKACSWFREVKEQKCSFDGMDAFIIHFKEAMKL